MAKIYDLEDGCPFTLMSYNEQHITRYLDRLNDYEKANGTGLSYHARVREYNKHDDTVLYHYQLVMRHRDGTEGPLTDFAPGDTIRQMARAFVSSADLHHKYS